MTSRASGIYVGHLIGASFGVVFIVRNGGLLGGPAQLIASVLAAIAVTVVLIAFIATIRRGERPPARDLPRSHVAFWVIVALEVVLLFGGLALLNVIEPAANVGWIALIVGLHFLAFTLWWIPGQRELVVIGAIMVALGVAGLAIAFSTHDVALVEFVSGFWSGVVLVATAAATAVRVLVAGRTPAGRTPAGRSSPRE